MMQGSPGMPPPQMSVHCVLHGEPAAHAQSFTKSVSSVLYEFMLPLMQHVAQSMHIVGSIVHAALGSIAGHASQPVPPATSHIPLEPVDEVTGPIVLVLIVVLLHLGLPEAVVDELVGEPGPEDGEPTFPVFPVPPPAPAEPPLPLPLPVLLLLEHAAKAKETDTATNAQDFMTTP